MSCPVKLQGLPSGVLEEVFTPANFRGRHTTKAATALTFPESRCALWDGSPAGEKLRLQFCSHRNPRLVLSEKALHLALRHARHVKKPRLLCFLLGTVSIDPGEESVTLTLDRFDPGRDQQGVAGRVPTAPLPGDVLVPCLFSTETTAEHGAVQSLADVHHCLKTLQQSISSRHTLDVSQLMKVRGYVRCSQRLDTTEFSFDWSAVCPSITVHAHAVRPLPIIPTALLRSLSSTVRPLHAAGRHRGFLTMDQSRKLLLLLESDPKACSLPLVGLWLSGVTHVSSPQVWTWCLRFLFGSALQDRVFSDSGSFLLVLFPSTHRSPQFFQCHTPTPQLDFQLLSASQCITLYQEVLVDGGTVQCELRSGVPSRQMDVFRDALTSFNSVAGLSISDQDSGVEDEDLSPRPSPSPHLPAQQARRVQPSVPELSLLIDSSFSTNHCSMRAAGSAHTPPAREQEAPAAPPDSSASSGSRAPHLHSTPNSKLQPSSCCCPPPITPSSPDHTPPPLSCAPHSRPANPPSSIPASPLLCPMHAPCATPQHCSPPGPDILPSDAYRLLLHQDKQLRLLQAQVQMLLEAQKKLQGPPTRSTVCVATATGTSLLWAEPQEVQAPPPASPRPPASSSSSSRDTSFMSAGGVAGSSPPHSPLLGESVSMYRPADDPPDFYHNLMTQLTSRLQEEEEQQEEESRRECLPQRSFPQNKSLPPTQDPVFGATVRRLQQLGVNVDRDTLTESERSRKTAVESASTLASISPAAVLSRLSVSESSAGGGGSSVDLSLEANAIALRYLSDAALSRLGGPAPSHDSLLSATNMSLATRKYMRRYGLIQEEEEEEEEESVDTQLLPPSHGMLQVVSEHREERVLPTGRCPPEASLGNILDLSRLRQLPKLF